MLSFCSEVTQKLTGAAPVAFKDKLDALAASSVVVLLADFRPHLVKAASERS
jgi:hypothetical protein